MRLGVQREDHVQLIFVIYHTWKVYHILPVCLFFNPPLGEKMRLNYQEPDDGVLYYSGYGIRGIYIYIYTYIYITIIADVNEKAI